MTNTATPFQLEQRVHHPWKIFPAPLHYKAVLSGCQKMRNFWISVKCKFGVIINSITFRDALFWMIKTLLFNFAVTSFLEQFSDCTAESIHLWINTHLRARISTQHYSMIRVYTHYTSLTLDIFEYWIAQNISNHIIMQSYLLQTMGFISFIFSVNHKSTHICSTFLIYIYSNIWRNSNTINLYIDCVLMLYPIIY